MATEKILIFDEAGNAKRMKVRIARFLDNEPVTATDKENIRETLDVDGSQSGAFTTDITTTAQIGAGTATPSSTASRYLTAGDASGQSDILINSGNANFGQLIFGDSDAEFRGAVSYSHSADEFQIYTAGSKRATIDNGGNLILQKGGGAYLQLKDATAVRGAINVTSSDGLVFTTGSSFTERWRINASGNLQANSTGIDFSSTSDGSGTMSSELLDDYEEGTWSPAFAMTGGDFTTAPTMDIISARYVKVGHMVTFYAYLRTDSVDITGAGGSLAVEGLPYANAGSNNYAAINVGQANFWTNAPSGGYVYSGGDYIVLTKRNTGITGSMTEMTAADLTAGVTANQNQLMISGSYFSF